MANIKSQIKRNRQNEKKRLRNRAYRGSARTAVSAAREAFVVSDPNTKEAVLKAISALDKAAERGVLHPNNAARRKSRLMKRLAALNAPAVEKKMEEPAAEEPKAKKSPAKKAAPKKAAAKKPAAKKAAKK